MRCIEAELHPEMGRDTTSAQPVCLKHFSILPMEVIKNAYLVVRLTVRVDSPPYDQVS